MNKVKRASRAKSVRKATNIRRATRVKILGNSPVILQLKKIEAAMIKCEFKAEKIEHLPKAMIRLAKKYLSLLNKRELCLRTLAPLGGYNGQYIR